MLCIMLYWFCLKRSPDLSSNALLSCILESFGYLMKTIQLLPSGFKHYKNCVRVLNSFRLDTNKQIIISPFNWNEEVNYFN